MRKELVDEKTTPVWRVEISYWEGVFGDLLPVIGRDLQVTTSF